MAWLDAVLGKRVGTNEPMAFAIRDALRTGRVTTFYAVKDGVRMPQTSDMSLNVSGHGSSLDAAALNLASGRVLDIGAGAGRHSLVLQERGLDVTAIEPSPGLCEILRERGVRDVRPQPLHTLNEETWDTMLLLFNGVGIAGRQQNLPAFLSDCARHLAPGGQLLVEGNAGGIVRHKGDFYEYVPRPSDHAHPSEAVLRLYYQHYEGELFEWFWPGPRTIAAAAVKAGLSFELLAQEYPAGYLGRITRATGQ
jgi:SAM-dependent methyltransferase